MGEPERHLTPITPLPTPEVAEGWRPAVRLIAEDVADSGHTRRVELEFDRLGAETSVILDNICPHISALLER